MKTNHLTTVAALSFTAFLGACDQGCENEVAQSIASPSGQFKVVVFQRGCGATTGFNTQASILKATDSMPNAGGNVLVVDGKVPMQVRWPSEQRVSISGLGSARVFKQEHSASGIAVEYQ